ncbi:GNAT family protein [Kineococcus endophyticus]|uniref:GNAT family protein n=1 Tax=Kineococcus endophyticus TaxID=1181883 RepID=A0ABV3PB39_9ACTN
MTRAVAALVRHLHEDRGLVRVEIRTAVGVARSRAVAERLGFVLEGVLRAGHADPDGPGGPLPVRPRRGGRGDPVTGPR